VELSLIKMDYKEVIPWVPRRTRLFAMPITTGQFTTEDALFSLAYKVSDLLFPPSTTNKHVNTIHYEGLELSDWVLWVILKDNGRQHMAAVFRVTCLAIYSVKEDVKDNLEAIVPEVIKHNYQQLKAEAMGILGNAAKARAGTIRNNQINDYDFTKSIDPTHTMLAKDANDNPLHDLAAQLAIEATMAVGKKIRAVWEGNATLSALLSLGSSYFVHPAKSSRFDEKVRKWGVANPAKIAQASDREAALERAKNHNHHDKFLSAPTHKGHKAHKAQLQAQWQFITKNYAELGYGQTDPSHYIKEIV